jgi:hypothetical protein
MQSPDLDSSKGIGYQQVAAIANNLTKKGINPTLRLIRLELGNTGSLTTINKYLKKWRAEKEESFFNQEMSLELTQAFLKEMKARIENHTAYLKENIQQSDKMEEEYLEKITALSKELNFIKDENQLNHQKFLRAEAIAQDGENKNSELSKLLDQKKDQREQMSLEIKKMQLYQLELNKKNAAQEMEINQWKMAHQKLFNENHLLQLQLENKTNAMHIEVHQYKNDLLLVKDKNQNLEAQVAILQENCKVLEIKHSNLAQMASHKEKEQARFDLTKDEAIKNLKEELQNLKNERDFIFNKLIADLSHQKNHSAKKEDGNAPSNQ